MYGSASLSSHAGLSGICQSFFNHFIAHKLFMILIVTSGWLTQGDLHCLNAWFGLY